MPLAVITLQFDPTVNLGGRLVRWETLAIAAAIVLALIVAAWLAGRTNRPAGPTAAQDPGPDSPAPAESAPATEAADAKPERAVHAGPSLRRDDLLYMAVGAIPGAVIGGRILYALDFFDYYFRIDTPQALLDPGRGTLSLLGAVLGGALTAAYVGWLIGAPIRRWLDVAIVPLLLAIGLGKFAMLLGGGGQGAISDVSWAVAFAGGGPWRSLGADLPAHPSQVYEGMWALLGVLVVALFTVPLIWRAMPDRLRSRGSAAVPDRSAPRYGLATDQVTPAPGMAPGLLFAVGLWWWALGRFAVGFTWRDAPVLGALNAEQLAALALMLVMSLALIAVLWPRRGPEY